MKKMFILTVIVGILAIAGGAIAATVTSNFNVTATVVNMCRISTAASNITFTSYDPTDPTPNDTGTGSFAFRCTRGSTYRLYITGTRTMTSGAESLNFELYTDLARTTVYPSAFAGATPVVSTSLAPVTSNIYGRIPALQDAAAGAGYTVTLTATVDY